HSVLHKLSPRFSPVEPKHYAFSKVRDTPARRDGVGDEFVPLTTSERNSHHEGDRIALQAQAALQHDLLDFPLGLSQSHGLAKLLRAAIDADRLQRSQRHSRSVQSVADFSSEMHIPRHP